MPFRQSHPTAARREILFRLSTAGGAAVSGQTFSGSEIQIRKAGGSLANAGNQGAVVELGSTGLYVYTATVAEIDTPGLWLLRVNKAGALLFEETDFVEPALWGTVVTGTLSETAFTSDRTEADNVWRDALVRFETGALANQVKPVGSFANSGGLFTLSNGRAFTGAPSNGDFFEILTF